MNKDQESKLPYSIVCVSDPFVVKIQSDNNFLKRQNEYLKNDCRQINESLQDSNKKLQGYYKDNQALIELVFEAVELVSKSRAASNYPTDAYNTLKLGLLEKAEKWKGK